MIAKYRSILIVLVLTGISVAQKGPGGRLPGISGEPATDVYPDHPSRLTAPSKNFFRNFYRKSGNARIVLGTDYEGISGSLIRLKRQRVSAGFSLQMNRIYRTNQSARDSYRQLQPAGSYYLIPFLLNIKVYFTNRAAIGDFVPYLIAGFGPALGLYMPAGHNFFNTLDAISGQIGGGGFLGIGTDYFWAEEWAISLDVRYNFFTFQHPLGENRDYKGISFFIGFSKALDS